LIHDPESILFAWGQDEEEGAMISANNDRIIKILNQIRNNNAIGAEYDFLLSYNKGLDCFGREITLDGKEYEFIAIDAPLLNHEEGRKTIISNRFLIDDQIQYQNKVVKDKMVAFSFQQYNSSCQCYTDAYFHIFIPTKNANDFEVYLLSKGKPIIPQIIPDEHFIVQEPKKCFDACTTIVKSFDSNAKISHNAWALATYNGTENIYIHEECYQMAINAMDKELESGHPVIVGVDYLGKSNTNNFDEGITDHWVVINGRGQNSDGVYYTYFEVASSQFKGTNQDLNRFVLTKDGYLEAINKTVNSRNEKPIITVIRLEPTSCACSRYNFIKADIPEDCGEFYNHKVNPKGTLIKIR